MKMMKRARRTPALPEDVIAYDILPRLPAEALMRFRGVSRSWRRLISSDPLFVRRQSARSSPALAVFCETSTPVFLYRRWRPRRRGPAGCPPHVPQFRDGDGDGTRQGLSLAACGGLLCVAVISGGWTIRQLYVGNPLWNDWRPLPPPPPRFPFPSFSIIGFAVYEAASSGTTAYKLLLPCHLTPPPTANDKVRVGFLVLSSAKGAREISPESVLLDPGPSSTPECRFFRNVYVEGVYYWHNTNEVLWFAPEEEHAGAIRLPSDVDKRWVIGGWDGKLSFMKLVDREIRLWAWNKSSWSFRILCTVETIANADLDLFTSVSLGKNLRNREPESLEIILQRCDASLLAFGVGFILLCVNGKILFYDEENVKAGKLRQSFVRCEHQTRAFVYARTLQKLTTPVLAE